MLHKTKPSGGETEFAGFASYFIYIFSFVLCFLFTCIDMYVSEMYKKKENVKETVEH